MPKQEVGSTKWLGNKMKAKGLQKLRWYCQMCQKQCRDENGFKCHRMSDGHQRQMQLFTQDPNKFMDEFSQEFELGFMHLMSHSYRSQRVLANAVYADFISNRHHTHMNATIWVTLSNFVQYLGRTNQCKIDKTPKGWYINYIDNSPEAKMREEAAKEYEKSETRMAQAADQKLQAQITDAVEAAGGMHESEFTALERQEGDAPIAFAMGKSSSSSAVAGDDDRGRATIGGSSGSGEKGSSSREGSKDSAGGNVLAQAFKTHKGGAGSRESSRDGKPAKKMSAMEQIMLENEARKRGAQEEEKVETKKAKKVKEEELDAGGGAVPWLAAGLTVKVMHQELAGGKYYRKKGKVEKVHDRFTCDIRMIDSRDLIRLEQELVETVIPNVGKIVRVVKGSHKGHKATMKAVDFEGFCVSVQLDDGTEMEGLGYDEVCKIEE